MRTIRNLAGIKFGRLFVLKFGPRQNRNNRWTCRCDCGNEVFVQASSLVSGNSKSCGCLMREAVRRRFTTHGHSANGRHTPQYGMFIKSKMRAKKYNLPFDITVQDIDIPKTCPVLGIPILSGGSVRSDNSPSIDRIIPSRGYTKGNIRITSWRANHLKNNATLEELRLLGENARDLIWEGH